MEHYTLKEALLKKGELVKMSNGGLLNVIGAKRVTVGQYLLGGDRISFSGFAGYYTVDKQGEADFLAANEVSRLITKIDMDRKITLQEFRKEFSVGRLSCRAFHQQILFLYITNEGGGQIGTIQARLQDDASFEIFHVMVVTDEEGGELLKAFAEEAWLQTEEVNKAYLKAVDDLSC